MKRAVLKFERGLERNAFIHSVWQQIQRLHASRNFDMCRPYNLLLKAAYSNSSSILLFGGLYECALFALQNSEEYHDICLIMLDRVKRNVREDSD